MPELILHLPEELISEENQEDLLTFINKEIKEEGDKFKTFEDWIRRVLRSVAVNGRTATKRWKSTKTAIVGGQSKKYPDLVLKDKKEQDVLEDEEEGTLLTIKIGAIQYTWLIQALVWENSMQKQIFETKTSYANVAEFTRKVLIDNLLILQTQLDIEMLDLEEEELLKGE